MTREVYRVPRRRTGTPFPLPVTARQGALEAPSGGMPVETTAAAPAPPQHSAAAPPATADDTDFRVNGTYRPSRRLQVGSEGERSLHVGVRAGDRAVRIVRPRIEGFRVTAPGHLALQAEPVPTSVMGRLWRAAKRLLIGAPIATAQQLHERLTKVKALAVFSSDALSSVAYSTEAVLIALVAGGVAALPLVVPIAIAIAILLAVVATSYRQTIFAYPNGGGSYIVAKDNLGTLPGLIAGAALLIDYVLTVAVSMSAGVAAITSAFPAIRPYQVTVVLACIGVVTLLNLRGVRESGTIFAAPTYLFVVAMLVLIGTGLAKLALGGLSPLEPAPEASDALRHGAQAVGLFLLLNAFAQGCSAMTGVEAISNGVPAFKPPESKNAASTLVWMASILGVTVVGTAILAQALAIVPNESETALSMMGRAVFGRGLLYQILQWSTFLILVLAANTSFADFPRLTSIMAKDKFLAGQFAFRGDRLAFTNGIVVLGLLAAVLVVIYRGSEQALIPLYAVGVFLSFTLSQSGMVMHWWRERGANWRRSIVVNGLGATTTLLVFGVIVTSKFTHGAWMVVVLIPVLVAMFLFIERHYLRAGDQLVVTDDSLRTRPDLDPYRLQHVVIIPIADLNWAAIRAVAYARSLTGQARHQDGQVNADIVAVHVTDDPRLGERLKERWDRAGLGIDLVILESPYRALVGPLLAYLDALARQQPGTTLVTTVLLPEYIPAHWWEHMLHTQTALRLKSALWFRPRTVVTSVPYHLEG